MAEKINNTHVVTTVDKLETLDKESREALSFVITTFL
jgi:hypothetical protein